MSKYRDFSRRFQYVLCAATSIAMKINEETLTYLNQGQPYEIKLKKLGDLSQTRGKVFKVNTGKFGFRVNDGNLSRIFALAERYSRIIPRSTSSIHGKTADERLASIKTWR